jgi:uncharacterized membrane protein
MMENTIFLLRENLMMRMKKKKSTVRIKDNKELRVLKKKAKDYIIVTLISQGLGLVVFTPYNVAVLNFTTDQLVRNAIASTGIAFAWNYLGYRLTATCSEKVRKMIVK